jgi:hypothetical protein
MKKSKPNVAKPKYEPTSREQASPTPLEKAGSTTSPDAIGSAASIATVGQIRRLIGGPITNDRLNLTVLLLTGIEPRDQIEAMLVMQMGDLHLAIMRYADRLARAEHVAELEIYEPALNRLARTSAALAEALNRYRAGGQQKVTVQTVSVSEGSQAIVGNVTNAPRQIAPNKTTRTRVPLRWGSK